jgi:hypothetical protein
MLCFWRLQWESFIRVTCFALEDISILMFFMWGGLLMVER